MKVLAVLENLTSFGTIMNKINSNFSDIKQAIDALEEGAGTGGSGGSGIILVDGVPGAEIEAPVDALALDVVAGGLYRKSEEDWTFVLSMKGTNGVDGSQWSCGSVPPSENGAIVPKVNDFYLNTTTYDVSMFNGVEWVWQCNIKGAPGDGGGTGADGKSAYELYVDNFIPREDNFILLATGSIEYTGDISAIKKLNFSPRSIDFSPYESQLTIELSASDGFGVTISFTDEEINIHDNYDGSDKKILNSDILSLSETEYVFNINNRLYAGMPVTFTDVYVQSDINNGGDPLTLINTTIISEVLSLNEWLESLKGRDGEPGQDGQPGHPGHPGEPGKSGKDGKSAYELYIEKNAYKPVEVGKTMKQFTESQFLYVTKDILNANDTASVTLRDANGDTYIISVEPNIQDNVQMDNMYELAINGLVMLDIIDIMRSPNKMIKIPFVGYPITIESVEGKEAFYIKDTEGLLTEDQWIESLKGKDGGSENVSVISDTGQSFDNNILYGISSIDNPTGDIYARLDSEFGDFPCIGIGSVNIDNPEDSKIILGGLVDFPSRNFTPGALLYAGSGVSSTEDVVETKPESIGEKVQVVGIAITPTKILFRPEYTFTVVE